MTTASSRPDAGGVPDADSATSCLVGGADPVPPRPPGSQLTGIGVVAALSTPVEPGDGIWHEPERGDGVLAAQDRACAVLAMAPVWPGWRVLEVGQGTGDDFTTVLLAKLVTPGGTVVSVRPDRDAPALHRKVRTGPNDDEITTLVIERGPMADGWPEQAPFDAIISWHQVPAVPPAWLAQCRTPGGVILTRLAGAGWSRTALGPDQHPELEPALAESRS